jgi:signal transduction histidine kinase
MIFLLYTLFYIFSIAGIFSIAFVVFRSDSNTTNKSFLAFASLLSTWLFLQYLAQGLHNNPHLSLTLLRYAVAVPPLMGFTFLAFSKAYIGERLKAKVYWLIIPLIVLAFSWTSSSVEHAVITKYGIAIRQIGLLYIVILGYSAVTFGLSVYVLYGHYVKHRKEAIAARDRVLMFSVVQLLAVVIIGSVLLSDNVVSQLLVPFSSFIMVIAVTYGVTRLRLFDIRFFVLRGAAYALTMVVVSALYIAPILYIANVLFLKRSLTLLSFVSTLFFASIVAASYEGVRKVFNRSTNRIFFRDSYDPEKFISELNQALVANLDIITLLTNASDVIAKNIKAEFCVIGLKETAEAPQRVVGTQKKKFSAHDIDFVRAITPHMVGRIGITDIIVQENPKLATVLRKNNISILARLARLDEVDREGLGYILLGAKKGGDAYNSQDVRILETIVNGLIVAIQNALRFEEIRNFNVTLQRRIDTATGQLRRTNAKLEALDETKDDFISMASHQLRTPLTAVKGYISMVLEGDAGVVSPIQKKMLNQAFMSSQRMVFLIADLLNVSRLKTGKFLIDRAPLNLANLIQQEIGQLHETARVQSLQLTYDKPKDFPLLQLDETKTRQVVMNFIDNAIHYTPAGGHITVELVDKPHTVELRVRDDGIGVPKSEQHHLFTKFYRAANARRQRPDGTGLGLFMAKKVIVAQGGAVLFDSRENLGSTFGFTLPKDRLLVG